jgi:hypothetical protein
MASEEGQELPGISHGLHDWREKSILFKAKATSCLPFMFSKKANAIMDN